jgi:hypothetical protein
MFFQFLEQISDIGMGVSAEEVRSSEELNGWLEVRERSTQDPSQVPLWTKYFCAIQGHFCMMYESEKHTLPAEIISLEYTAISANKEFLHAFDMVTPLTAIELRAMDDVDLERWTDAIFALQSSDGFANLLPGGMVSCSIKQRLAIYPSTHDTLEGKPDGAAVGDELLPR